MDSLNDKTKRNRDSVKENHQHDSDPIIQSRDESINQKAGVQSVEATLSVKKPLPLSDVTLLPSQFLGTKRSEQAAHAGIDMFKSVLHFKLTILVVFVITAAPLVSIIWTQIVPKYQARAEVRVRPIIPYLVFRTDDNGMIPLYNSFLNTQVSIIRSLTVLQRVLEQQEIQKTQWYKMNRQSFVSRFRDTKMSPIERLRDNLSVRPRRQTEIIDTSFIATDPKEAELIMNTVLEQYVKYIREMSDATEDALYRQLGDQYKSLESEIQGREKIIAELRNSIGTGAPEELISSKRINLDQAQLRLNELQQHIALLEWDRTKLEELRNKSDASDSNDITSGMEKELKYSDDPEWRQLDVNMRTIQHNIENSVYSSQNPEIIRMKNDLKFAEELLRRRESQLDEQYRNRQVSSDGIAGINYEEKLKSMEYEWKKSKREEQFLIEDIKGLQEEYEKLFKSAQLLEKENNELSHKRELFEAVRQRIDQKNMERNVSGTIDVLMWAFVPSKPYNDRRVVFTAMVLILALGLGCGSAILRASKNQVIYTPEDVPLPLKIPHLGNIPLIRFKKPLGKSLYDEIEYNHFLLKESVRVMRTTLLSRLDDQGSAAVLISSSTVGTGKSSFTRILGKCMAQAGKKVLIIDVDFHKMTLTKWFNLVDKPGFLDCMNLESSEQMHVFPTEIPTLKIMPTGKRGKVVEFEQIANGTFKSNLEELRKKYSIILMDCSPVLPIADATIMSSQVDGTIMVERELVSRRGDVINAVARLNSAGGHILGIVFVGSVSEEKYGYGYSSYYKTRKT